MGKERNVTVENRKQARMWMEDTPQGSGWGENGDRRIDVIDRGKMRETGEGCRGMRGEERGYLLRHCRCFYADACAHGFDTHSMACQHA